MSQISQRGTQIPQSPIRKLASLAYATKEQGVKVYRLNIGQPDTNLKNIQQNVILNDSVSKRYSECGIRIGAPCTKNRDVLAMVLKFCQARLSHPLIEQIVAEASIDDTEGYSCDVYSLTEQLCNKNESDRIYV